jgi:hypothetical protein
MQKLEYPNGLSRIYFLVDDFEILPAPLREHLIENRISAKYLYEWAEKTEKDIIKIIDDFYIENNEIGVENLFSIELFNSNKFIVDDTDIDLNFILMLDDMHKLTKDQNIAVKEEAFRIRPSKLKVWISERLEALPVRDLFSRGSTEGRDYSEIRLEKYWRDNGKFSNFLDDLSNKRLLMSTYSVGGVFKDLLTDVDNKNEIEILNKISTKVREQFSNLGVYDAYFDKVDESYSSTIEKIKEYKILEILISREMNKGIQLSFFQDVVIEDYEKKRKEMFHIASSFLSHEYNLTNYYGFNKLVQIASSNVEQYLSFASEFFEKVISKEIIGSNKIVDAKKQEKVFKDVAKKKWDEIPVKTYQGSVMHSFLEHLCSNAKKETLKPTAPIAQGVTGFGIRMNVITQLIDKYEDQELENQPKIKEIYEFIAECISQNILEVHPNVQQGNDQWMIFYFNRWLCVHFGLPLGYGGWKPFNTLYKDKDVNLNQRALSWIN